LSANESTSLQAVVAAVVNATSLATIGVDVDPIEPVVEARVRLMCRADSDLPVIRRSARAILEAGIRELEQQPAGQANRDPAAVLMTQALKSHRMIERSDAPGVVELRFRCEIPPALLEPAREFLQRERDSSAASRQAGAEPAASR